jgi:hypothetical protein
MEVLSKGGVETVLEGQMGRVAHPTEGGVPPDLFWSSWLPYRTSLAYGLYLDEKLIMYFSFDF